MSPPKLSLDSLLSKTPNWRRVEPINWFRSVKDFLRTKLNMHYHTNFMFISLVCRIWRSTFLTEMIFRCSIRPRQKDRTSWTIQTHSDELNRARGRTFHEVNSLSLVRFLKSSTCGLGLRVLSSCCTVHYQEVTERSSFNLLGCDVHKPMRHDVHDSYLHSTNQYVCSI